MNRSRIINLGAKPLETFQQLGGPQLNSSDMDCWVLFGCDSNNPRECAGSLHES
jgi:hypothetical protein